ncbi:MAG: IS200/IS605 family transposase [Bacillota bacterium]
MHDYRSYGHGKYALHYHLLWCPKAGLQLQGEKLEHALQQIIADICRANHYEIVALEVQPRFIYVSLSVRPTVAPADAARTLKSMCTVRLLQLYPELKKHYSLYGSFWKKGYLISTGRIFNPDVVWKVLDE